MSWRCLLKCFVCSKKVYAVALLKEPGPGGTYRSFPARKGSWVYVPFLVWGWLLNALKHGADLVNFPSSLAIDYNSMQQETWATKVPEMLLASLLLVNWLVLFCAQVERGVVEGFAHLCSWRAQTGSFRRQGLCPRWFFTQTALSTSPDTHSISGQCYSPLSPMPDHIPLSLCALFFLQGIYKSVSWPVSVRFCLIPLVLYTVKDHITLVLHRGLLL